MKYRAAAIQFEPVLACPDRNVPRLLAFMEEAARAGARLIVAPEMANVGYCFANREEIAPYVEAVPGPFTGTLARLARQYGCVIVCGLAERDESNGLYYNTAALIGPDGYIGKYRKIHFFSADAKWAVEGDGGFGVWDTPIGRIGVEVCMDATYPEAGRLLALQGADVVCFPTNWVGGQAPDYRWISQAFENGVYWVAADRQGEERGLQFMGGSCIVDPDGSVQALAPDGEAIVFGDIDLHRTRKHTFRPGGTEDKLADRRPELYHEMLQAPYTWSPSYFHTLYDAPGLPVPKQSRIGVVQFQAVTAEPRDNLRAVRELVGDRDLDLVVLPELALSGRPTRQYVAETGMADLDALIGLARDRSTLIVSTVVEQSGDSLFNTVVLVSADGLLHAERKRHLQADDREWAAAGDSPFHTVDTPVGRIGLVAGFDAMFWETLRVLATEGADLICVPAGLPWPLRRRGGPGDKDWIHWRSKAWESCAALAVANYPGPKYAGASGVWIPDVRDDRSVECVAGSNETLVVEGTLDTHSRYIREKRGLGWRRTQWYTPLVAGKPSVHGVGAYLADASDSRPDPN